MQAGNREDFQSTYNFKEKVRIVSKQAHKKYILVYAFLVFQSLWMKNCHEKVSRVDHEFEAAFYSSHGGQEQ